jgi:TonB family protein
VESNISGDKSLYIRRIVIFLVSAALHAAGFYAILHVKLNYKIYKYQGRIIPAIILPEESIAMMRFQEPRTAAPAKPPALIKPSRTGQLGEQGAAPGVQPAEKLPAGPGGESSGSRAGPGGTALPGGASPGFRLVYPKGSRLDLSKSGESPVGPLLRPNRYTAGAGKNLAQYTRSGAAFPSGPGAVGSGGPGRGGARGSGAARGAALPENIVRYNFSPWANAVMNKLQQNWSIYQAGEGPWRGEVGISVTIAKNGDVLAAEVQDTSHIDLLDQAALRAVALSAPFPPLPADFPADSVAIYFVFQVGNE